MLLRVDNNNMILTWQANNIIDTHCSEVLWFYVKKSSLLRTLKGKSFSSVFKKCKHMYIILWSLYTFQDVIFSAAFSGQRSKPGATHRLTKPACTQRFSAVISCGIRLSQTVICRQRLNHETNGPITLLGLRITSIVLATVYKQKNI